MPRPLLSHFAVVFAVSDVPAACAFYKDYLGFEVTFSWEDPPSYAVLKRDNAVQIHLSQSTQSPCGHVTYVYTHDVDALYAEFLSRDTPGLTAPRDQAYGMRDFDVEDPFGNRLSFGMGIDRPA